MFAAGFIEDKLTLSLLSAQNLQRTDIQNLAKKVSYRYPTENEIPFPTYFPGLIFVTLTNGETITERLDIQYGNPQNPMSLEDIVSKFYDNAELVMKNEQAAQLAKSVLSFETKTIQAITQLLRVGI